MTETVGGGGLLVDDHEKESGGGEQEEIVANQVAGDDSMVHNGDQFNILFNAISTSEC